MKKTNIALISIVIILIGIGIGVYSYYKYKNVDEVTDYFSIIYEPPVELSVSFLGPTQYTEPKVECRQLPAYQSDSAAVATQSKEFNSSKKFYLQKYDEEMKKSSKSSKDELNHLAMIDALKSKLSEQRFVISFTHHRNYKPEDFLNFLKKNGVDWFKFNQFCKDNGLKATYFTIN